METAMFPGGYVVKTAVVLFGWYAAAVVLLVGWSWLKLAFPPPAPRGCVDTCFGNVPLVVGVGFPVLVGLVAGLCVGFAMMVSRVGRLRTTGEGPGGPLRTGLSLAWKSTAI